MSAATGRPGSRRSGVADGRGWRLAARRRAGAVVLAASVVAGVAACSPALNWRQVTLDGGVQALFPCRTETRARSGVPLEGRAWSMTQTACETQGMTFAVTVVPVPPGEDRAVLRAALARAAVANVSGRAVPSAASPASEPTTSAASGGGTRWSVQGMRSDGEPVRLELLLLDRPGFVYQGAVVGRSPQGEAVRSFLDELSEAVRRGAGASASP